MSSITPGKNTLSVFLSPEGRRARILACCGLLGLAVVSLITTAILESTEYRSWSLGVGATLGLAAACLVGLQFLLAARLPWLERAFGLDKLYGYHKFFGIAAACLALTHPLVLFYERGVGMGPIYADQWPEVVGALLLLSLGAMAALAVYRKFVGLPYDVWKLAHRLGGPAALVLLGVHITFVNGGEGPVEAALGLAGFAALLLGWVAWRFVLLHRLSVRYLVESVQHAGKDAHELRLVPAKSGEGLVHGPGQFAMLSARALNLPGEEHPFTIAGGPRQDGSLSFTIRCSGDYTARIGRLQPGESVRVSGPYGLFSHLVHAPEPGRELVFIAGGVGVTPFLSQLRYLRDVEDNRPVTLIWANRTEEDIVHHQEFRELARQLPSLRVVHVLSRQETLPESVAGCLFEHGRLNEELLGRHVGHHAGKPGASGPAFFLCGPPAMMEATLDALASVGIARSRVVVEVFAF